MIAQRNLSLLTNQLFKEHGGRRIPEAVLERDYCLAWFLVGLSQASSGIFSSLKGGTALQRCMVTVEIQENGMARSCCVCRNRRGFVGTPSSSILVESRSSRK